MIWSKHVLYPDKGHGLTLTYLDSAVFPEPNQINKRRVSTCSFFFFVAVDRYRPYKYETREVFALG